MNLRIYSVDFRVDVSTPASRPFTQGLKGVLFGVVVRVWGVDREEERKKTGYLNCILGISLGSQSCIFSAVCIFGV